MHIINEAQSENTKNTLEDFIVFTSYLGEANVIGRHIIISNSGYPMPDNDFLFDIPNIAPMTGEQQETSSSLSFPSIYRPIVVDRIDWEFHTSLSCFTGLVRNYSPTQLLLFPFFPPKYNCSRESPSQAKSRATARYR